MFPPMLIAIVIKDEKLCINFKEIWKFYLNSQPLSSKKPSIKIYLFKKNYKSISKLISKPY